MSGNTEHESEIDRPAIAALRRENARPRPRLQDKDSGLSSRLAAAEEIEKLALLRWRIRMARLTALTGIPLLHLCMISAVLVGLMIGALPIWIAV